MEKNKYACAYTRFSTDHQNQSSTIGQLRAIRKYAEEHDFEIIDTYIDEAQSGTNTNRTNFQKLLSDAPSALWKTVIVYNMSRLSRSVKDTLLIKDKFEQMGIKVLSVIENQEETPEGDFFNLITYGMNELYVKQLTRDSWRGLMVNAKEAKYLGGKPPFGYDKDKKTKKYIVNTKESEAVKYIFDSVLKGKTYREIADYLNSKGYTNKGNQISYNLTDILRNRRYTGVYIWNEKTSKASNGKRNNHKRKDETEIIKIEGGLPRIISDETFNAVQKILDRRSQNGCRRKPTSRYYLSGLIKCGYCGYAFVGENDFSGRNKLYRPYYKCNNKRNSCKAKDINREYLDKFIQEFMLNVVLNSDNCNVFQNWIKTIQNKEISISKKKLNEIENTKKIYEKKIKELAESLAYAVDDSYVEISKTIGILSTERAELESEGTKIRQSFKKIITPLVTNMKKEVIQEKKQFRHDPIKRKEITMKYINKILVDNSYVTIYFNLGAFINNEFLDETYIVKAKEDRNIIANKNKHNLWKVGLNLFNCENI